MDRISQRAQFELREINRLAAKVEYVAARFVFAQSVQVRNLSCSAIASPRLVDVFHPHAAPQQTLQARDQNRQLKGLRQIIIRARCKTLKHILSPTARG